MVSSVVKVEIKHSNGDTHSYSCQSERQFRLFSFNDGGVDNLGKMPWKVMKKALRKRAGDRADRQDPGETEDFLPK